MKSLTIKETDYGYIVYDEVRTERIDLFFHNDDGLNKLINFINAYMTEEKKNVKSSPKRESKNK